MTNYIVLNKKVYAIDDSEHRDFYRLLLEAHQDYKDECKKEDAEEMASPAEAWNYYNNYCEWIEANLKPVSEELANLDLHRYDQVCPKCYKDDLMNIDNPDYPF